MSWVDTVIEAGGIVSVDPEASEPRMVTITVKYDRLAEMINGFIDPGLLKQNVMLCMYLSQIAWGNTAKQQSAWAEEALNKTKELSKLILCSKDHVAITKNDSEVEFFHIVPHKTLLYRAITDIRKVL